MTHLYTLVIRGDNSFEIFVDMESKKKGSLLEVSIENIRSCYSTYDEDFIFQDMQPPVNPPKEIDDPKDFKPKNWVDEEMMDDPAASKPDGTVIPLWTIPNHFWLMVW